MKKLVIFNLRTDESSDVLGAAIDWIKEFEENFIVTDVVSTHVGVHSINPKIKVLEIGGGNFVSRIRALFRLIIFAVRIIRHKNQYFVFHHMSPRTAVFPGILFRINRIPQGLWYSHSTKPLSLKLSVRIVTWIFSSEPNSFPIKNCHTNFVGHGISLKRFGVEENERTRNEGVLFVGRISPIKNLISVIEQISILEEKPRLTLIGPQHDVAYVEALKQTAQSLNVELSIEKPITYEEVNSRMLQYKFFYSGMNNSVDKSALEAAISGCLILSTDDGTLELSGMKRAWDVFFPERPKIIADQISILTRLSKQEYLDFRRIVMNEAARRNSLENTIKKIADVMLENV